MSTCKYCGKDAGWFSKSHKECEDKHDQGVKDFEAVVSSYFTKRATAADVQRAKQRLTVDAFLSEEDVCTIAAKEIRQYTASIHRPFSPSSMRLMDEFLTAVGVSYSKINKDGAVDEFVPLAGNQGKHGGQRQEGGEDLSHYDYYSTAYQ